MASGLRPRVTATEAAGAGNINLLPSKLIELAKFVGVKSKIQGNAYIHYVTTVCKSPTSTGAAIVFSTVYKTNCL